MSNILKISTRDNSKRASIEEEASAWIVRLHDTKPTAEVLQAFQSWSQKSPAHRQAFKRMTETWNNMDVLAELAFPLPGESECIDEKSNRPKYLSFLLSPFRSALSGATLLFLLALSMAAWQYLPVQAEQYRFRANYETTVGELKKIALPDGSGMRLNTQSKTSVVFNRKARIVHLLEGEAHFEVFHDATKPFVVYAGKVAVRAVGTAFSVYIKGNSVDVIVTDGEIKVASLPQAVAANDEVDLTLLENAETVASFVQGQHAVFQDKIELVETIKPQEITKKLSWRDGMLIFDGDSLQDVVDEISRYTPKEIVILDADIRELKIGGYFRAGEITPMLDTLAANFNLKVEEINDNLIYLSQK